MKRFTRVARLLGGFALIASVPEAAQTAAQTPAAPATAATTAADPALWVLRDEDTTVYLFGTVHLLPPGIDWYDDAVKAAFDASDELTLEVTLPEDTTAIAQAMTAAGSYPAGTTLSSRLTAAQRDELTAALQPYGVALSQFDGQEPWFTTMQLSLGVIASLGYDPANGVEQVLRRDAAAAGKRVTAFETVEQQIGFFDQTPESEQITGLVEFFRQVPQLRDMFTRLIDSWTHGQPDETGRIMNENLTSTPETARIILTDRNRRWADAIRARMDQPGTVFVAVGAGHLAGDSSVQHFLQQRGMTVQRVEY